MSMKKENESPSLIAMKVSQCLLAFFKIPFRADGSSLSSSGQSAALWTVRAPPVTSVLLWPGLLAPLVLSSAFSRFLS